MASARIDGETKADSRWVAEGINAEGEGEEGKTEVGERETKEARDRAGRELGVALSLHLRSDKSVQSLWISCTVGTSEQTSRVVTLRCAYVSSASPRVEAQITSF